MCNNHKKALQPAAPNEPKVGQCIGDLPCQRSVPIYPLRYGIADQPFDAGVLPTLSTTDYPALKGGKAYGLRVLRPNTCVYLFYFQDGRMWTQHYQVTPDGLFAPLWWTDADYKADAPGRQARPHLAGAKPYLPAPEANVADTVYLMVSDTVLTHCKLWEIENNTHGLRDALTVKVQPAGGAEQKHAFNATLLGQAAPDLVRPGIAGQARFPWSESQPESKVGAGGILTAMHATLRPRTDIVPLAVALPDAVGIASELNHLATTAVQAKAKYAAANAHKLQSAGLINGYFRQAEQASASGPRMAEFLTRQRALVDYAGAQRFPTDYEIRIETFEEPIKQAVEDVTAWVILSPPGKPLGLAWACFDWTEIGNARDYEAVVFACTGALVHSESGRALLDQFIDAPGSPYWMALAGGHALLRTRLKDKALDIAKGVFDVADKYSEEHAATPATDALLGLLQTHLQKKTGTQVELRMQRPRHILETRMNATLVLHDVPLGQMLRFASELNGYQALGPEVMARWNLELDHSVGTFGAEVALTGPRTRWYDLIRLGDSAAIPLPRHAVVLEGNPLLRLWHLMREPAGYAFTGVGGFLAVVGMWEALKEWHREQDGKTLVAGAGAAFTLLGASVEIGAAVAAYKATKQGSAANVIAANVFGAKIGTALLGSIGAGLFALTDAIKAVNAANDTNSHQAGMYLGAALAGSASALAAGAGGSAAAATLSSGTTVAVLGLTPAGWAIIALVALGAGIAFTVRADNAKHGPIDIWLKHSAWGIHQRHYTLKEELEAYHSLLFRPRLSVQWEDGAYSIGTLIIHCTLPASMQGERFAHDLRVMLGDRQLQKVRGPMLHAPGYSLDYRAQCVVTRHGADGALGPDRGWTIAMHEDAVVELEYLYQANPQEQPDIGFTQPGFPQPLRITAGGWLSGPVDEDKLLPVGAPQ